MAKLPGIFIVDPDPDARYQIQQLIPQTGFAVSGQSGLGTEAVAQVTEAGPDIILCGLKEPVARVVQTIESIAYALPETPIIVYADTADLDIIRKAMLAGARNFLESPLQPDQLKRAFSATLESEERRHLRQANNSILGPHGAIITVFGAKGGIGKTTVAANLAVAFVRQAGQSCVLVDADDSFGDAAAALAVTPEQTLIDGLRELDNEGGDVRSCLSYHNSGLAIASAPEDPLQWRQVKANRFQEMLHRLARQFDVVLVDTAGTLGEVSQAALEAASLVLWLTTPDYASVRDSLQALRAVRSLGLADDRIRFVLNVTSPEFAVNPAAIEDAIGMPLFWTISYDRLLRQSGLLGQAIVDAHPNSAAARQFSDLSRVLSGLPLEPRKAGLLSRVFASRNGKAEKPEKLEKTEGIEVGEEAPA